MIIFWYGLSQWERGCYIVTPSLIARAHTGFYPCNLHVSCCMLYRVMIDTAVTTVLDQVIGVISYSLSNETSHCKISRCRDALFDGRFCIGCSNLGAIGQLGIIFPWYRDFPRAHSLIKSLFFVCRSGDCDHWWRHTTTSDRRERLRSRSNHRCPRGSRGESQGECALLTNYIISHFTPTWKQKGVIRALKYMRITLHESFCHHRTNWPRRES